MDATVENRPAAWLPLTPRGVAAFAYASLWRLLLVQFMAAALGSAAVVWMVHSCWFPSITAAVEHLPEEGTIKSGRLEWTNAPPQSLSESRFMSLAVDLTHSGEARSPAQIQIEFGQADLRVYSIFGCAEIPYPPKYTISFNYPELKPWWGAWAPIILALTAGGTLVALLGSWTLLASLYCLPAWLMGLFMNRELTFRGSWLVAGAALIPGALMMAAAITYYGMGKLDLVRLSVAWIFHLALGWVYLVWSITTMPKISSETSLKQKPFADKPGAENPNVLPQAKNEKSNPFRLSR